MMEQTCYKLLEMEAIHQFWRDLIFEPELVEFDSNERHFLDFFFCFFPVKTLNNGFTFCLSDLK